MAVSDPDDAGANAAGLHDAACASLARLLRIMARLRAPDGGCPWDLEQTWDSIVPHTLEECYEVCEAIEQRDFDAVRDELGDLLFQSVFYARIAEEEGRFDFAGVLDAICDKLERRHPHVFADSRIDSAAAQAEAWEAQKQREREAAAGGAPLGALSGVSTALPALTRAAKLQRRAAAVGFDWPGPAPVQAKVEEELAELAAAMVNGDAAETLAEAGDLLFACVNLVRHAGVDPEQALRAANRKFERRFAGVEALLAEAGLGPADASLARMDACWEAVKAAEREGK